MTTIQTITTTFAATMLMLVGACDAPVDALDREADALDSDELEPDARQQPEELPLANGEERFGEGVTVLDRVELPGGTELTFVHLDLEGEESLGVIERRPAGALGLPDLGMEDASFLDLYLAVTEPEVEIPLALLQLADDHELGERGWLGERLGGGLDLLDGSSVSTAACNAGFQSALINWKPAVNDGSEWGLGEDPDSDSDWYGPTEPLGLGIACSNCTESWWHRDYYNDQFEIFNVDEMKMSVSACSIGWRPWLTAGSTTLEHYGPTLRFRYRTENNASTGQVYSNDLDEVDEGGTWSWYWQGSPTSGDNDFDWTIEIA
ncbi:MAG: hypothetical protein KDK70_26860, partial [Myxococcales bacterium]|nr:hypothetical protein [Myxococcales bacterium]